MTESLSEGSPSAETARSLEDEDLLQRSTKKTKRVRNTAGQSSSGAVISGTQETPTAAGLTTPESAHWRTPVETPSNAWGRGINAMQAEAKANSEEEPMDDEEADPNCPVIRVTKEEKERLRRP